MEKLVINIDQNPQPWQRVSPSNGRRPFVPAKTRAWERLVCLVGSAAKVQWQAKHGGWPLDGWYEVSVSYRRERDIGDDDNVYKAVLDGLEGVLWKNDRRVWRHHILRDYPRASPGITISVLVTGDPRQRPIAATRTRQDASGDAGRVQGGSESGRDTGHAGGLGGACQCSADYEVGSGYRCKACKWVER